MIMTNWGDPVVNNDKSEFFAKSWASFWIKISEPEKASNKNCNAAPNQYDGVNKQCAELPIVIIAWLSDHVLVK